MPWVKASRLARGAGMASSRSCRPPGSIENIKRLTDKRARCIPAFALMQDGTPVPEDAEVEVLGRLPDAETLLLLGKRGRTSRPSRICAVPRSASVRKGPVPPS